jgi:hypothetical protein
MQKKEQLVIKTRLMKTTCSLGNNSLSKGNIFFGKSDLKNINKISRRAGFCIRQTSKIKPFFLIFGFYKMLMKNLNTYEDWSSEIGILSGKSLSKQAVEERMNTATSNMLHQVFEYKLNSVLSNNCNEKDNQLRGKFNEIKIDDSTVLCLPEELNTFFPGNVSLGRKKAQIKIHALHNLTKNSFDFLNVHNYTDSDQGLSGKVLPYLNAGDLILRDLGFQNLTIQKQFISRRIYFVSKKKSNVCVFDIKTGLQIDLLKYLKKKKYFDGSVLVGVKEKVQMRLVIQPLSKEIGDEKRRKAKKDRDRRVNHSKEYYELLGYSILITNIPPEMCIRQQIGLLYGLRWRIETIFKSWKSTFSLEKILPKRCNNPERVNCIIYLMLLMILLFQMVWLRNIGRILIKAENQSHLSILKLAKFFIQHFIEIAEGINPKKLLNQLKRQCWYEVRSDRENTMEKYFKMAT